jgi:hypothetical protein
MFQYLLELYLFHYQEISDNSILFFRIEDELLGSEPLHDFVAYVNSCY